MHALLSTSPTDLRCARWRWRAPAAGLRQLERQPESVMGWVPKLAQESICFVSSVVRRLSRGWQRLHSGRTRRHAGIGPVGFTCDAEEGGGV